MIQDQIVSGDEAGMAEYVKQWAEKVSVNFCKKLISKFDVDERVQKDPQPDYSTRSFLLISNLPEWSNECKKLDEIVKQNVNRYFSMPKQYRGIAQKSWSHDGYLIARYQPGDACILHVDGQCSVPPQNQLRLATFLLYLNTIDRGGETEFPLQNLRVQPEAGKIVMFPPMHTHPHEVLASDEPRYILQTWVTDPEFYVVDQHQYRNMKKRSHNNTRKRR